MQIKVFSKTGLKLASYEADSSFSIPADVLSACVGIVVVKMVLPVRDIAGYFHPALIDGPVRHIDWNIRFGGYSTQNYPILTFFSLENANRYTVFFDNLTDDFECATNVNQRDGTYELTWKFAVTTCDKELNGYIDTEGGHWTHAYSRALKILRPQGIPDFPAGAWQPVYCTWYAVHANLTNEYLDANAKIAAELGCGTFIVDDGWCYDEMKRVTPETIGSWYDDIGDWKLSEAKLPSFKDHVEYAQSLGLKYLLWVAPYFCFKNSDFFKGLPDSKRGIQAKYGTAVYDITDRDISRQVQERLLKIVGDLKLDGLKIDFLDVINQDLEKPIGRYSLEFVQEIVAGIRKLAGRDALIEFRQRYATPQMLDYGTQFRAADAPFDYLCNISRLAVVRVLVGDGVPVHADPLYWCEDELDVTIARHMIASLAAVPMLSMDLSVLPAGHIEIVSHYLNFYKEHIDIFSKGHWEVRFADSTPTYLTVTSGTERICIILDAAHLPEAISGFSGTCHILNLSASEIGAGRAFGLAGKELDNGMIPPGGRGISEL